MGMSTHIVGVKPADAKFDKMYSIYKSCLDARVSIPKEVEDFFDGEEPDEAGVVVDIEDEDAVVPYQYISGGGFEIDLRELDKDIKLIRFYNAW